MSQRSNLRRFASSHLRHDPEGRFHPDPAGWVDVAKLMAIATERHLATGPADIDLIMGADGNGGRFELSPDGLRVRALTGHTVPGVDTGMAPYAPDGDLFFGTEEAMVGAILQDGLLPRSSVRGARGWMIRLSTDEDGAAWMARRRSPATLPAVIRIDATALARDGQSFLRAPNGEILTSGVAPAYMALVDLDAAPRVGFP